MSRKSLKTLCIRAMNLYSIFRWATPMNCRDFFFEKSGKLNKIVI